ncbi:MAG: hypothetical protein NT077_03745 [Candidatus Taylorbacteria bacterium]|nr:hypothetical protein [Candidatus Taylorbacteria bacterium]
MKTKTALLSVFNKAGIAEFARELIALGVNIFATGDTVTHLRDAVVQVDDAADFIFGGPIPDRSVVSMSQELHAALLARHTPNDEAELSELGIPHIDLVCVDLCPFENEIPTPGFTHESAIEKNNIDAIAMILSATKGQRLVICDPADRAKVLKWLNDGEPDNGFIGELRAKAEFMIARYYGAAAMYHGGDRYDFMAGTKVAEGKGENGPQGPSIFYDHGTDDPLAHASFEQVQGIPMGHVNRTDLERLLQTITHAAAAFDVNFGSVPHLAIGVKHGNACGGAYGTNEVDVLQKMLEGDLQAIFGGYIMTNFVITQECAEVLLRHKMPAESKRRKLDGIVAPGFTPLAVERLKSQSGTCRLIGNPALGNLGLNSLDAKSLRTQVRGGHLKQGNYRFVLDLRETNPDLKIYGNISRDQRADLCLAWSVCATSNSNTITGAKNRMLIGNGVGQMSRVRAARLMLYNATDSGHDPHESSASGDSYFPFIDGPETLINSGVTTIFATSGSINDQLIINLCKERGVTLLMMPDSLARGFFGHGT